MNGTGAIIKNTTIIGELEIFKDLNEPMFTARVSLGNPYVTILNKTVDLCKFQKSKKKSPFIVLIVDMIQKHFSLGQCPFKKVCILNNCRELLRQCFFVGCFQNEAI